MSNVSSHYWSRHTVCIPSFSPYFPQGCHILCKIREIGNTTHKQKSFIYHANPAWGRLALWKSMSLHKVEHLEVSHKIRVCFFLKGGDRLVKAASCLFSVATFVTTKAIPSLQSNEINFGSLIMFGVYQCLKLFKCKGKEAVIYWVWPIPTCGGSSDTTVWRQQIYYFSLNLQTDKTLKSQSHLTVCIKIIIPDVGIPSFWTLFPSMSHQWSNTFPVIHHRCSKLSSELASCRGPTYTDNDDDLFVWSACMPVGRWCYHCCFKEGQHQLYIMELLRIFHNAWISKRTCQTVIWLTVFSLQNDAMMWDYRKRYVSTCKLRRLHLFDLSNTGVTANGCIPFRCANTKTLVLLTLAQLCTNQLTTS